MTDKPHVDHEDDLYWQLESHAANHPSMRASAPGSVDTINPLDYSIPCQLHGQYSIPYELSQAIEPLSGRADYLQSLWLDDYMHTMDNDGELHLPDVLRQAACTIQANSYAIRQEAATGRFQPLPDVPKLAAAAYQNHGIKQKHVSPLQVRSMLALSQFIAWFNQLTEVLSTFNNKVAAKGWNSTDKRLFAFAANDGLASRLRPLIHKVPDLLDEYNKVEELTCVSRYWSHPDLETFCQRLDAYRWKDADVSALPESEDELEHAKILIFDWFSSIEQHINQDDRNRTWNHSLFPALIRGVQGVLIAINPNYRERILSYSSVCDIPLTGLTNVEEAAVVLLRQLFNTQVRNIDGPGCHRLIERLRILMQAVKQDMPNWVAHQQIVQHASVLVSDQQAKAEQSRINGRKSEGRPAKLNTNEIIKLYDEYLANGTEKHNITSMLAGRFGVEPASIRYHLKKRK